MSQINSFENSVIKEYSLRIVPEQPLYDDVLALKKEFRENFGKATYLNSLPHISIANFMFDSSSEAQLIKAIEKVLAYYKTFRIDVNGFVSFQGSNALVMSVYANDVLTQIQNAIKHFLKDELKLKAKNREVYTVPHITIAKATNFETCFLSSKHVM
jgi:2'-5' RNA ligase